MKPSNTPERRLERVQRHRRRKRREGWIDDINKIAAHGGFSSFLDRALETGIRPKPYLRLVEDRATEPQLDLDYWEVATGEWLQELSRPKRLAVQAMRAKLRDPSGHSTEFGGDASRYLFEWWVSDSDVGLRLQLQLSRETDSGGLEDQVELWALARRANRNTKRRRLKLLDGGQKEFDIAEAASKVREITVTRALRLLYVPRLMLQSARVYDSWGDIKHSRGEGRYHWDAQPLHLGEVSKEEENVNRATFKAPIPGAVTDREAFRPTWWAGRSPVAVKIGLHWIPGKALENEHRKARIATLRRMDRSGETIAELRRVNPAYIAPWRPPIKHFGSHKARPIDRWQDRAECSGRGTHPVKAALRR
jgi:hypothetical protein